MTRKLEVSPLSAEEILDAAGVTPEQRERARRAVELSRQIPLGVKTGGLIQIQGDLDGSPESREALESQILFSVDGKSGDTLFIDAVEMRITPEGLETWLGLVKKYLMGHRLVYGPSLFTDLLPYEDDYDHSRSEYLESSDNI